MLGLAGCARRRESTTSSFACLQSQSINRRMQRAGPEGPAEASAGKINDTPKTDGPLAFAESRMVQTAIRLMISRRSLATLKLLRILLFSREPSLESVCKVYMAV